MFKKYLILTNLIFLIFSFTSIANAATLYSNPLTTNFWNTVYDTCNTSSTGLNCGGAVAVNTTQLPTVECLSGHFNSSMGNPQLVFASAPNTNSYVVAAEFNNNSTIIVKDIYNSNYNTGVVVPSGSHIYGLCQKTNQLLIYIDNSLAYTLNANFPHLDYVGFTLFKGTTLTNFIATDGLPGELSTILYSNNFTSDFWNTIYHTCSTTSSGLTCDSSGTVAVNTTPLPTAKCISGDFNNSVGNPSLIFTQYPNTTGYVITANFINNSNIIIKDISNINHTTDVVVPSGAHNYSLCQQTNELFIYIDNVLKYTFSTIFPHLNYIGFVLYGGTTLTNFKATDTLPSSYFLPVPLLKQTDNNWGSQIYDTADKWTTAPHQTIGDWGCALTSATMVLQYSKITKLPDGTSLDPGTLNTWLKNQKDGYMGNGLLNWLALSRLSKLAKAQNPDFSSDALEYKRKTGADTTTLLADLQNNQPDILEEPGHFVVGTGQSDTSFTINDPYYNRTDLTQGYNNTFLSLGRYVPSHTDLSYMLFVTDENTSLELKDATGSAVGELIQQQPLINDTNDNSGTVSGSIVHEYLVPQPESGTYFLTTSGSNNSPYNVKVYLYDKDGNVLDPISTISGVLTSTGLHISEINFDKQSTSNDTIAPTITIGTLLGNITHFEKQNAIQKGFAFALRAIATNARNFIQNGNIPLAKVQLGIFQGLLNIFHNRGVTSEAYNVLNFDVNYLLNSL